MFKKIPLFFLLQSRFYSCSSVKHYTHATKNYTFADIVGEFDEKYKNILVMVGAGLSTPSGIPDFRSPGTGLYDNLKKYHLSSPELMFDLSFFKDHPAPFLNLARELYPGKYKPNLCHYFIRLLQDKGRLLRLYTQNIDGLERLSGIKEEFLVEAHGTFSTASCINCKKQSDPLKVRKDVFKNIVSKCEFCGSIVKPDIVFFGEELPQRYYNLSGIDPGYTDFLIIIGTSLEVYPFAWLGETVPLSKPRLLINREKVGMIGLRNRDVIIEGDIIKGVQKFTKEIGWYDELIKLAKEEDLKFNKS